MYLTRGQRIKLSDLCKTHNFTIEVSAKNNLSYDISCFGLDEDNNCSDDRYMIFYNQKNSPCNSINLLDSTSINKERFTIDISKLPSKIKKLTFTMTIDGQGVMSDLIDGSFLIYENNKLAGGYKFSGNDFNLEKTIMVGEIYLKGEWRISAVGHGFNGGLSSLLEHFGIEEEKSNEDIIINMNNAQNNNQNSGKKSIFSSFIKGILAAPFKFTENKINQSNEYNQKRLKQENFRQLLINCLSDGVLTKEEMTKIEIFCLQNSLNLQECLTYSQPEIENFIHGLLADIVSDAIVTHEEEATINSVCNFLNPSAKLIQEINETLIRVKFLSNIKSGNIEPINNHTIITKIDELVWHRELNVKLKRAVRNERRFHDGEIFVTSDRIIFKSYDYPAEILLKNIIDMEVDGLNFFIIGKTNRSTFQFYLTESERLGAYTEQAVNKYHRKLNLNQTAKKTRTIGQDVKQAVWLRDKGQCIECTSNQYLEFDHIIPFSKGGANSIGNIQLLCRKCNLKKSDRI